MTSWLIPLPPASTSSRGARTNGSCSVPLPDAKIGSDVVFSGSGPVANISSIFSFCNMIGTSSKSSSSRIRMKHQPQLHLNKFSGVVDCSLTQFPESSVSGTDSASSGSVSQSISARSEAPSLSSSKSSTNPVVELPVIVSGSPSPSVSIYADASVGKASGPAVQLE